MPHILFVCTANLYRSPLAAAFFEKKLQSEGCPHDWVVESAGTWTLPGQHVPLDVLRIAASINISLKGHITRQVNLELLARHDLIIVMNRGHREALVFEFPAIQERVHLLSELADQLEYDVIDPATCDLKIDEVAAEILKLVYRAYPRICQLAWKHDRVVGSSQSQGNK